MTRAAHGSRIAPNLLKFQLRCITDDLHRVANILQHFCFAFRFLQPGLEQPLAAGCGQWDCGVHKRGVESIALGQRCDHWSSPGEVPVPNVHRTRRVRRGVPCLDGWLAGTISSGQRMGHTGVLIAPRSTGDGAVCRSGGSPCPAIDSGLVALVETCPSPPGRLATAISGRLPCGHPLPVPRHIAGHDARLTQRDVNSRSVSRRFVSPPVHRAARLLPRPMYREDRLLTSGTANTDLITATVVVLAEIPGDGVTEACPGHIDRCGRRQRSLLKNATSFPPLRRTLS